MLFVEEFKVDSANLDDMEQLIKEALKVIKDMQTPYLKSVKVYHSNDNPAVFRVHYDIERRIDIQSMRSELNKQPQSESLVSIFYSLIVKDSYNKGYYDLVNSIGKHRFSSLPSNNKKPHIN